MKHSLSLGIFLGLWSALTLAPAASAQEQDYMNYHSCDFNDAIPADYALYDLDGQTLHYTMTQAGIKQGEAWARKKEPGTTNYYAASACRYKEIEGVELKPSDDWLIMPAVWIRGSQATLSWRAMSVKNRLDVGAGYEVLVSTTGNTPAHFTSPAVFSIGEEALSEWTTHEVDLSAYHGEHIYIAFHNNSAQGEILAVDDIVVSGHKGVCNVAVTTDEYSYGTDRLNIDLCITSYSDAPITDMTLYYRHGNQTITETLTGLSIAKHEAYNHTFATPIVAAYGDTARYTVGAIVNSVEQDEIECTTMMYLFKPTRKVVVEEATGLWCQYCPAGIVAMEILEEKYPEQFIGLALHYNDEMGVDEYVYDLDFDGFPTAWVNRNYYVGYPMILVEDESGKKEYVTTNGGLETYFTQAMEDVSPIDVAIASVDVAEDKITVETAVRPAMNIHSSQYQLAYVIVENDVWEEGYAQVNVYSGKDAAIGGWESLPGVVTDRPCQHVVRYIHDGYQGVPGSLPTRLMCGEEYNSSQTFDLPDNILDIEKVEVVVMLIDMTSGEVMNAAKQSVVAAVATTTLSGDAHCYATDGTITVELPGNATAQVAVYSITGTLVASCQATDTAHIAIDRPGIYLVQITTQGTTHTYKVRL